MLIGVALVIAVIAIFNDKLLTRILGRLGHSWVENGALIQATGR